MAQDFDSRIAEERTREGQLRTELEQLRTQFIQQVAIAIADWYPKRAREIVSSYPEVAQSLGSDGLRELKRAVEDLTARSPELAERELSEPKYWWHLYETPPTQIGGQGFRNNVPDCYLFHGNGDPPVFAPAIRTLMSHLGRIFYPKGFLKAGPSSNLAVETSITWPEEAKRVLTEYLNKVATAQRALSNIERIEREKAKTSVSDLWDAL